MARMLNRTIAKIHVLLNFVEVLINIISEGLDYIAAGIGIYQLYLFVEFLFQHAIVKLIHM